MKILRINRFAVAALGSAAVICGASHAQAQMKQKPAATSPMSTPASVPSDMPLAQPSGGDAIARVANINVSADDIRAYVAGLPANDQAALAKDPSLLSQAVRQILAGQLVLLEARARKWDEQAEVAAKLEKVRDNALAELYLESVSTPPRDFPTEDQLQKVYDANSGAFLMPRQFELAQVFIASPKGADKATEDNAKKNLDEVLRKLKTSNADFGAIANETGTPNGGILGWVAENQVVPDIRSRVLGLAKGAVSEPIRLDDGWHIVKLIDTKASYTRTLPEVRDQLVLQIRGERSKALRQAYLGELLKKNPPAINELALSKILGNPSR